LEAQPGDILAIESNQGYLDYGLILGVAGEEGLQDDVLQGMVRIEGIPRAGENFKYSSLELQDMRSWSDAQVVAVARLGNQGKTLSYWNPQLNTWSSSFLNLPTIFVPHPTQAMNAVGKWFIVGYLSVAFAEAFQAGAEALGAGPWGIPATVLMWAGGTYMWLCWYNFIHVPTE